MLRLSSHGIFRALENGAPRSAAIAATAGTVGLVAGKLEDCRKTPLVALAAGAGLQLVGLHTLGDGAMSGAATLVGYRMGARHARRALAAPVAQVIPGTPTVRRVRRG